MQPDKINIGASTGSPSAPIATDRPRGRPNGDAGVSLPVVPTDPVTGIRHSRAGRWRAYSLTLVHLAMIGHVLHWLWAGSTLTPIEPSEAMETIRHGEINMGFLFFAAALAATLILGRWVCGWGCHLIAYQDLTLWLLKKLRLRPKPFRSRFFIYIPLVVAAGWMFILPLADRLWRSFEGHPSPAFTWHLARTGFWDTFPGVTFSILSVLVCGVAIIYFLGPKAFCTFACPYGAFFGLTDKFAPGRIRVTDACQQCGHCTAVCTSNVRVAEEVKLYQMVVDPGCMKCLDCVQVCPNDALYYGFGRPSLGARPAAPRKKVRYDLTLAEELLALVIFLVSLFTVNGLYGQFPFLLSLGVACVMTLLFAKGLRVLYARDVLLQRLRLKVAGRIQPLGRAYLVGMLLLLALTAHSAVWRYHDFLGKWAFDHSPPELVNWQYDSRLDERATVEQQAHVAAGVRHLEACERWGLFRAAENDLQLARLYLFTENRNKAAGLIRTTLESYPDKPDLWLELAQVETLLGRDEKAREAYESAIALESAERETLTRKAGPLPHPLSSRIWTEWGVFQGRQGDTDAAVASLTDAIRYDPGDAGPRIALAELQISLADVDAARNTLLQALRAISDWRGLTDRLSKLRLLPQDHNAAVADYRAAIDEHADTVVLHHNLAHAYTVLLDYPTAVEQYRRALEIAPESLEVRADLGAVLFILKDFAGAVREYALIHKEEPANVEASFRFAFTLLQVNRPEDAIPVLRQVAEEGDPSQRRTARGLLSQLTSTQPAD